MAPHNFTELEMIVKQAEEFDKKFASMRTQAASLLDQFSPILHGLTCLPIMVLDQIRVLIIFAFTLFMVYLAMTVPGAQERLISALVPAVSDAPQGVVFTTRNSNASIRNPTASVNASVYKNVSVFERTQTSNLSLSLDFVASQWRCIPTPWLSCNITTCAASVVLGGTTNATQNFTRDDLLKFQIKLQTWVGFTPYFQGFLVVLICCNTLFALNRADMSECTRLRGWRCLVAVAVLTTVAYFVWCAHFSEVYMTKALAPHGWDRSLAVLTARAVEERVEVALNFTQRHFTEIQQHKIVVHVVDRFVQLDLDLVAQLSRRANLKVQTVASMAASAYRMSVAMWNGPVVLYSLDTVTQAVVWVNAPWSSRIAPGGSASGSSAGGGRLRAAFCRSDPCPRSSLRPSSLRPAPLRPSSLRPAPLRPSSLRPAPLRPAPLRPSPLRPSPLHLWPPPRQSLPTPQWVTSLPRSSPWPVSPWVHE